MVRFVQLSNAEVRDGILHADATIDVTITSADALQRRKVRIAVNLEDVATTMGAKAVRSKGQKSVDGAIRVTAVKDKT